MTGQTTDSNFPECAPAHTTDQAAHQSYGEGRNRLESTPGAGCHQGAASAASGLIRQTVLD